MVRTLGRKLSWPRSFSFRKMFDGRNSGNSSFSSRGDGRQTHEHELAIHGTNASPSDQGTRRGKKNRASGNIYHIVKCFYLLNNQIFDQNWQTKKLNSVFWACNVNK